MATEEYGPWNALSLRDATKLFGGWGERWFVSSAIALELFTGRSWRSHNDLDIGVLRSDVPKLKPLLSTWDVQIAAAGVLRPWTGRSLSAVANENNLWCRDDPLGPWRLDIQIGEGNNDRWTYRRDHRISLSWKEAVLVTAVGVPYLSPQVVLLFKSKDVRRKDGIDAVSVIPELDAAQREWLLQTLPAGHEWRRLLVEANSF